MLFAVQITASAQTTLTLGGFDSTRGGEFSLAPGKSAHSLAKRHRHRLSIRHPYCLATLTTTYLDTVNVLLMSSIYSEGGGIASPLSTSEQKALVGFVERGGIALLFVDEDANISTIVSNSFVSPFGIHVTGQKVAATLRPSRPSARRCPYWTARSRTSRNIKLFPTDGST